MKEELTDTPESVELVRARMLRERGLWFRIAAGLSLSDTVHRLAIQAIRRAHPLATDDELLVRFCEVHYGRQVAESVRHKLIGSK